MHLVCLDTAVAGIGLLGISVASPVVQLVTDPEDVAQGILMLSPVQSLELVLGDGQAVAGIQERLHQL
jgi:hypothetical protein